jgi:hypothetical protein
MREPVEEPKLGKPRPNVKKAANKPALAERIRFWLWRLTHRK